MRRVKRKDSSRGGEVSRPEAALLFSAGLVVWLGLTVGANGFGEF